jgi:AraC-like DNA-binding protein
MSQNQIKIEIEIPENGNKISDNWLLDHEDPMAKEFAQPLFDSGVMSIALVCKDDEFETSVKKSEHHLFLLIIQGDLNLSFGSQDYLLKPGMLSFLPLNKNYSYSSNLPCQYLMLHFFDKPIWEPLKEHGRYLRKYESTDHLLILLKRILESSRNHTIRDRLNALDYSRALADLIKRETRIFEKNKNIHLDKIKKLIAKIHISPEEPWTVSLMAKSVHLSPRSLNRIFHREYGIGPMDFVISKRLHKAFEMLVYSDDKIEAVASSLGYKSINSFSNLFLRHTGMRPGEFRNKYSSEK